VESYNLWLDRGLFVQPKTVVFLIGDQAQRSEALGALEGHVAGCHSMCKITVDDLSDPNTVLASIVVIEDFTGWDRTSEDYSETLYYLRGLLDARVYGAEVVVLECDPEMYETHIVGRDIDLAYEDFKDFIIPINCGDPDTYDALECDQEEQMLAMMCMAAGDDMTSVEATQECGVLSWPSLRSNDCES